MSAKNVIFWLNVKKSRITLEFYQNKRRVLSFIVKMLSYKVLHFRNMYLFIHSHIYMIYLLL